jgi:hypothetical protein
MTFPFHFFGTKQKAFLLFFLFFNIIISLNAENPLNLNQADIEMCIINDSVIHALKGEQDQLWNICINPDKVKCKTSIRNPDLLVDNLVFLHASMLQDRDLFINRLKKIRKKTKDPILLHSINSCISKDEYLIAKRLKRENTYNHFTVVLNRISAAVNGLFTGQIQSLFQLPVDLSFAFRKLSWPTPRDRKNLFLLELFTVKYPESLKMDKARSLISKLEKKKNRNAFKQEYRSGKFFLKKKNYDRSLFHFKNALNLYPESAKVKKKIALIKREIASIYRSHIASRSVLDGEDFFLSQDEKDDYKRMIYSLVSGDNVNIISETMNFMEKHPTSNYIDDVRYAASVIYDYQKDRCQIIDKMKDLLEKYPGTNAAHHAYENLNNTDFNPQLEWNRACGEYRSNMWKFILTGGREPDDQIYIISSSAARSPVYAAQNVGIFFALDIFVRGIKSVFKNPVSPEFKIDAASKYYHRFPNNPESRQMCKKLTGLHNREGNYIRALKYARAAGDFSHSKLKKLKDREARKLYLYISASPDLDIRTRRLHKLILQYPDAPVCKKAKIDLDNLVEISIYDFQITRDDLKSYQDLWIDHGLTFLPDYYDGIKKNGEITEKGLLAVEDGPILYYLENERFPLELDISPESRKNLLRAVIARKKESILKEESPFPLELSGGFGSRGFEAYPSFLQIPYNADDLDLFR